MDTLASKSSISNAFKVLGILLNISLRPGNISFESYIGIGLCVVLMISVIMGWFVAIWTSVSKPLTVLAFLSIPIYVFFCYRILPGLLGFT